MLLCDVFMTESSFLCTCIIENDLTGRFFLRSRQPQWQNRSHLESGWPSVWNTTSKPLWIKNNFTANFSWIQRWSLRRFKAIHEIEIIRLHTVDFKFLEGMCKKYAHHAVSHSTPFSLSQNPSQLKLQMTSTSYYLQGSLPFSQ